MSEKPVNFFAFPRPNLGDKLQRYSLIGLYEEAAVLSLIGPEDKPEEWSAVLMTRNGVEFVTSDKDFMGRHDWVPRDWYFSERHKTWIAPDAEEGDWDIPAPKPVEKFPTWRARVFKALPEFKKEPEAARILSDVWHGSKEAKLKAAAS